MKFSKILICGGSGMVGRNLIDSAPERINLLAPSSTEMDLLDFENTQKYIASHQPDLILHAAGRVGGIQANMAQPVEFLVENMVIGKNIIEAARLNGVRYLLNFGSSCMYPRNVESALSEDMVLSGELEPTNEGYAIAKIFAQRFCAYINKEYSGYHYKTVIPCNLYGKYDKFDPAHSHMIPAVIKKIHEAKENGEQVVLWGDGTARREFMYAEDLSQMVWKYLDDFEHQPELMNLGLGSDYSILEYYQAIANVIGYTGDFAFDLTKPVGMKRKLVDVSLQKEMGLEAKHSLQEGVQKTYSYFLNLKNQS